MKQLIVLLFLAVSLFSANGKNHRAVTLQLKWNHQFQFAGYYIAKEKGYYSDAGIDVSFKELKESKDPYGDVLGGRSEFGIYTSELLLKYHRGDPIVALGAIFQHSPLAIMSTKYRTIKSLRDYPDAKIMLEHGSAEIEAYLKRENIKLYPKNVVEHSSNLEALIDGKIDAMTVYVTDEPYRMLKKGDTYKIFSPSDAGIDFYGDILFTTKEFAKSNPKLVEDFKKASMRGWEYALAHKEEAVNLILKKYNGAGKSKEQLLFEASQMQKLIKSDTVEIGYLYPWRLENMLRVYGELGMANTEGRQDIKDFILENYLQKIRSKQLVLTNDEKNYLASKKEIKICIDPDWLPFERLDNNGAHEGMSADILKIVSGKLHVDFKVVKTSNWQESLAKAQNRECDILPMAMETHARGKYFNFSKPYFSSPLALVTKGQEPFLLNMADAFDKPIALVKEYAIADTLKKKYPNANFIEVKNRNEGLKKVSDGSVYGYVDALAALSYALSNEGWGSLKIAGRLEDKFELSLAIRNDDKMLYDVMDKALFSIDDGERSAIFGKWFGVSVKEGLDYKTAIKVLSLIFVILLLLYYKNVILRRQVEKETNKRLMQEQMFVEHAKMAQMGEMLDMIAHQWKQPLSTIGISVGELHYLYSKGDLSKEIIDESKDTVKQQIGFLVKMLDDMRSFLKPNQKPSPFDMAKATDDLLLLLKGMLISENIEIETCMDENVEVMGVKNLFQNVLLSIIVNSKEIFKMRAIKHPKITITLTSDGDNVVFAVKDNGGGIAKDAINKVFDYRFTTKVDSGGTGIGLYFAKMVVKEKLGGDLVAFNLEDGACFEMRLKAVK